MRDAIEILVWGAGLAAVVLAVMVLAGCAIGSILARANDRMAQEAARRL